MKTKRDKHYSVMMIMMMIMMMMMMVYYDDALWQLASVSDMKQATAVHCAGPMPRFI